MEFLRIGNLPSGWLPVGDLLKPSSQEVRCLETGPLVRVCIGGTGSCNVNPGPFFSVGDETRGLPRKTPTLFTFWPVFLSFLRSGC